MTTKEDFIVKGERMSKETFQTWLRQPMTRALISVIPPMENQDMLVALLEAAFTTGFSAGEGHVMIEMISHTMKDKR